MRRPRNLFTVIDKSYSMPVFSSHKRSDVSDFLQTNKNWTNYKVYRGAWCDGSYDTKEELVPFVERIGYKPTA